MAGDNSIPLLETKLHAPRRRGVVDRPRLRDRLDLLDQPALTLVSAGAGFGKTTLVAEWFADGPATGWVSLDRRDNDPSLFWAYVTAAARAATSGIGSTTESRVASAPSADAIVTALLNDLHNVVGDVVLVLDDYHVIESTEIHEAVTYLVEHLPSHIHLVISSRTDPPLPLAAMRARGDLLEIRAADLRFTGAEAAEFLRQSMGLTLAPADLQLLGTRTEGWIAALKLAALSMQGRDDPSEFIAEFAGDDRFILDYLVGEVLDRQDAHVRRFLLETSVLARLSGPLCDAVTGRPGGRAMLEQLERANLFVVPLDDRRTWYRYHHLFADVLRARLLDSDPDLVAELHGRASDWHELNDGRTEAISHALAGQQFGRAAQLIELATPELRRNRQDATLRRWLDALPPHLLGDHPVLAANLVGVRLATGDLAGPLLDRIEAALEPSAAPPVAFDQDEFERLPVQLLIYRAGFALLTGDLLTTVSAAEQALALVEPTDHLRRGSATALLALAHWATGDLHLAERRYAEAISELIAADHLADMLGCSLALADIQIALGRLGAATRTFEEGLRWTSEHPGLRGAADMHVGLSEVLIERNELDAAAKHLQTSADLGELAGLPQHAYRWRVTNARLSRANGDLDEALDLIDAAAPLYDTDFSPPVRPVGALRARVELAHGNLAAARAWAAERGLDAADDLTYVREFEHITLARVLIAAHAADAEPRVLDDALGLLTRLLDAAEDGERTGSVIEILVLLATAHQANGDVVAAVAALEDALRRAEPEGHVRLFLHAGPGMTALLRSLASQARATPHVKRVLAAVDLTESSPPAPSPRRPELVDELSVRELDVLRLLRSELNGPEIARELVVSLNTVRTHTKNIYAKLGASNRREAVRRAAELGL